MCRSHHSFILRKQPETKIPVPEGSSIVLKKCEPHQFINLDGPESPVTLLAVFGPSLQSGDSFDVANNPQCLEKETDTVPEGELVDPSSASSILVFDFAKGWVLSYVITLAAVSLICL